MQQYNAIVQTGTDKGNKGFITYHKISCLIKFVKFIDKEFPKWRFYTVYDHKTKAKINLIKRN
jgi:hypothetical protein